MPLTDEDVSASMQREAQFESRLNDARAYFEAADYESTLAAAQEARRFLAPGASSAELDAIVGAAQSARARIEGTDRQEQEAWQRRLAMEELEREHAERERMEQALAPCPTPERRHLILRLVMVIVPVICVAAAIILWLGAGLISAIVIGLVVIIGLIVLGMASSD